MAGEASQVFGDLPAFFDQKKIPFCSWPIRAKLLTLVEAGLETNRNPCPLESVVTIVNGVVAVTATVALVSRKVPRIRFADWSAVSLARIPLQSISSESMTPRTWLTARFTPAALLATVNASNTQICLR